MVPRPRFSLVVCLAGTLAVLALAAGPARAAFRAAVAKVDITPDSPQWLLGYAARQSDGIHDRIYHRIAALDDGNTQVYLVSSDLCFVAAMGYHDQVLAGVEKETGIPARQIWWMYTHTHSAPEVGPPGLGRAFLGDRFKQIGSSGMSNPEYSDFVGKKLVEGLREARSKLETARLAAGTGFAMANINRRAREVDGRITLGLEPYGPTDRQIGLLRLERPDGSLIGLIANYAVHGTVLGGQSLVISGDAPGIVAEHVEKQLGAPMLFINGAEGNLAPIYTVYPNPRAGHLTQFAVLLGDRIIEAYKRMPAGTADVTLTASQTFVETPMKAGLKWPEDMGNYTRTADGGQTLVRIPVRFLRINRDLAIWATPLELFCEIAIDVRNRSPFANTFYFGLWGSWFGYLTTAQAMREKGYEPSVSPYTEAAEEDLRRGVLQYLHGMPR